jgi:hypothetical protein
MERADQGSPLPADPAGREDIMSDEQAGRQGVSPSEPEGGTARAAGQASPLPSDPARREDVIREDVIREDVSRENVSREDVIRDPAQPGDPAAGG